MKFLKNINEKSLKKIYEKCKPSMQKKFGRVLTYDEFVAILAKNHSSGNTQCPPFTVGNIGVALTRGQSAQPLGNFCNL